MHGTVAQAAVLAGDVVPIEAERVRGLQSSGPPRCGRSGAQRGASAGSEASSGRPLVVATPRRAVGPAMV